MQEALNDAKRSASQKINDVATTNDKILDMWPNTSEYVLLSPTAAI